MSAHGVMWGRLNEPPFWDPEERQDGTYWERGYTRIKYLALPYVEEGDTTGLAARYLPVELRLMESGGSDSFALYRLRSGDIEIVWTDQETDVLICEVDGREIIDGLEAHEIWSLAVSLDYQTCIAYHPNICYVNDEGELVGFDQPGEIAPPSVA